MNLKEKEVHAARMRIKNAGQRIAAAMRLPHGPSRTNRLKQIWTQVANDQFTIKQSRKK